MFCSPELAARIDRAEGRMCAATANHCADGSPFVLTVAGGVAVFAGPDSPTNKMIGIGFKEPVDASSLAEVEARFGQRSARIQAEISTLAEPGLHSALVSRGYVPSGFENVLGHDLKNVAALPTGIVVSPIKPEEHGAFADVMVQAFANPDVGGVGGDGLPPADEIRKWVLVTLSLPGFRGYLARADSKIAGGGCIRIDDRLAQFGGAGTLPEFRRRGVQTALLRARLADAARSGCDLAVVVTQPASKSQQNVQREGFSLLYSRQLLVKSASAGKSNSAAG